jgi:ATP-binding cassette, subfamily B, bacterial PglK
MTNLATISQLRELWGCIDRRRQKQFYLLLILMVAASLAEVVSVGAVLPFLGVLTAPEQVYQYPLMQPIVKMLEINSPSQLILPITIVFISASIIAGAIRVLLLYTVTKLSFATGADLSVSIYRRTLYQEYSVHISRNSSEIISGILSKTSIVIGSVMNPVLLLISSIIMLVGITSVLFAVDAVVAMITFVCFGFLYWIVITYSRQKIRQNSQCIADKTTAVVKSLQEGLGGIRDVLIDGTQEFYCKLYRNSDLPLRHASGNNQFISGSPRYIMESIGMTLIAILAYAMTNQNGGISNAIPVLGVLALGAQRLLPALQQAYSAYSSIKGASSSVEDVLELLRQPISDHVESSGITPILFKDSIQLKDINFQYTKESPCVLGNINLRIDKGECIGFIGATGSGKSTLIDIIMGLLSPNSGEVLIDGQLVTSKNKQAWQTHIAHVPQSIYLSDSTISENIAFGIPKEKIDHIRVKYAAEKAQISEIIDSWKEGYQTFVGEQGVRLSGGQRQRIGIARALYKRSKVLVFDEATSALDSETEASVMKSINTIKQDLTILIIAHRVTTLKECDKIIEIGKNADIKTLRYKDIASGHII